MRNPTYPLDVPPGAPPITGPFEGPWERQEFETYFHRIGLPNPGQQIVLKAFSTEPTRPVGGGGSNVTGQFQSPKMCCSIQYESRGPELSAIYRFEYSSDVHLYACQPFVLPTETRDSRGNLSIRDYHVDFLVLRQDGVEFVSCKGSSELRKDQERKYPKFQQDDDGTWRHPAAEKALEGTGIRHVMHTSTDVNPTWVRNVRWFRDFVGAPRPEAAYLDPILNAVREADSIRLRDLLAVPGATPDTIWWAVANREVWGDWEGSLLFEPDFTWLHASKAAFLVHKHVTEPGLSAPPSPVVISLERGELLLWNQIQWKVLHRAPDAVDLQVQDGSRQLVSLAICDAEALIADGRLAPISSDAQAARRAAEAKGIVERASEEDIKLADDRMAAISHLKLTGKLRPGDLRVNVDRYRRWARKAEKRYGNPFLGLIRRRGRKSIDRSDPSRLSLKDQLLNQHAAAYCADDNAGTQEVAFGKYLAECEELGIKHPRSREKFRRAIKEKPLDATLKGRTGEKSSYSAQGPVPVDGTTTPPHGDRIFEEAHFDHWTIPVPLVCSRTGTLLGTADLALVLDGFSTMPLGFHLHFDAPGRAPLFAALRDVVRRYNRLPDGQMFDQANHSLCLDYGELCARAGMDRDSRPPSHPRFGSRIERIFRAFMTRLIGELCGNTTSTEALGRGLSASHHPANRAGLTLFQLRDYLEKMLFEVYPDLSHQEIGATPRQLFEHSKSHSGERPCRYLTDDFNFRVLTALTPQHPTRVIDPGRGIKVQYLRYWNDEFADRDLSGHKVEVKLDPVDPSFVYAHFNGRWIECPLAQGREHLVGRTRQEVRILTQELVRRRKISRSHRDDNALKLGEMHRQIQAEQRDSELAKRYARAGEQTALAPPQGESPRLQEAPGDRSVVGSSSAAPHPPAPSPSPPSSPPPPSIPVIHYEDLEPSA